MRKERSESEYVPDPRTAQRTYQTGPSSCSLQRLAEVSGAEAFAGQDPFVSEEKHSEEEEEEKEESASMRFQRIAVLTNDIYI